MPSQPPSPPRESFEAALAQWRAPYAINEAPFCRRRHPEPEHPYRTCFQRDRERIMHCSAFRRLDFKTQVFVPHEHDHFRTRMTHTLEVAQIGRSVGRALRLNEDLIEAVALAHDLGHPPFGHSGESVLDELMAADGHFEHNRQSLRVVDYLEHPYPDFRGLNLTDVVRECIGKHKTRYDTPLPGEFDLRIPPPLEGQVVDAADEIAYTSADLQDALEAGWLTVEAIAHLKLWRGAWQAAEDRCPGAGEIHRRIRACKAVLSAMTDDLIEATAARIAHAGLNSVEALRQTQGTIVGFSPPMAEAVKETQTFLLRNVYQCDATAHREAQTRQTITGLFGAYRQNPSLLPPRYAVRIPADGLPRVICDYIAGMTDRYCKQQYAALFVTKTGD